MMNVELIRIGNSRGIRIPKAILEQCGFGDTAELRIENETLVLAPATPRPRAGWEEAFDAAGPASADELLLGSVTPNEFDRKEWRW